MELKDIIENNEIDQTIPSYTPSSAEKKKVVMMYLFFGIIVYLSKKDVTGFEYYHLKQASGWWIIFLLVLVFDVVLLFIPGIRILGLLPLILLVIAWIVAVMQARKGVYQTINQTSFMKLFPGVGNWFIELFELNVHEIQTFETDIDTDVVKNNQKDNLKDEMIQKS